MEGGVVKNRAVAISLRLYRALAGAFPEEFKNAYGEELVQVAEDAIEPIWQRHGALGLVRLLVDIAWRVPAEYLVELRQDIGYGLRMLAGSPGFTAVAVISLSLGICAPTSFFSEINASVLRDLPGVTRPGELVTPQAPVSYPMYGRYRERSDLFTSTLAYVAPVPFGVSLGGRTERTWGHLVTPSYFSTLGVRPVLGRVFDETWERPGRDPAVVVSYRFWQNHLGADPAAVGTTLRINGHACTVLGVGPREFLGASPMFFVADLWLPLSVGGSVAPELADNALERRDLGMFQVIGRLRPGVTVSRAEAQLSAAARRAGEEGQTQKGRRVVLKAGGKLVPTRNQDLPLVMALPVVMIGLLLLIACSNVANMMLARAADRRREIAVRLALGASRARLVRQLLTESILVAAGSGIIGFLLTYWLMHLLARLEFPHAMPVSFQAEPDGRVLLLTLALTVFTGLAFGLAPALGATNMDLTPALKEGGHIRLRGYRRFSLRNMMVLYQMASLTLVLVTGTVVLAFLSTTGIETGFDPSNLYLISVDPIRDGYSGEQATVFFDKILDRVKRLPRVTAASLTESLPMGASGRVTFAIAGPAGTTPRTIHNAVKYVVGSGYFETTRTPILLGRGFQRRDQANDAAAAIVNERFVREYWNGRDALGGRIEIENIEGARFDLAGGSSLDYRALAEKGRRAFEVVGVAKDVKMESALERARPAIYLPLKETDFARPSLQGFTLLVRTAPGVDAGVDAMSAVRREISSIDARLTPFDSRSMSGQIDRLLYPARVGAWGYGLMGLFGLIMASAGVAGVTAYSVTQRRHEIGIRLALGARRSQVLRLVMQEGAALVTVGTGIGLAGAWAFTRVLSASVEPVARVVSRATSQPLLLVGSPLLLAGLALAACYIPARKSTRIEPVVALRQE